MAIYDWNHDGKKNMVDDYIEFQIYKNPMEHKKESSYTPRSSTGMSTFGAILSVVSGLLGQVLIYMILDIDVKEVSEVVIIILWIVISSVVAVIAEAIGI